MKKVMLLLLCVLLFLPLYGCKPSNKLDYVKSLEPGVSNRGEVLEVLGDPIKDVGSGVYIDLYEIERHIVKIGYGYTPNGDGFENWVVNFVIIDGETYLTWDGR